MNFSLTFKPFIFLNYSETLMYQLHTRFGGTDSCFYPLVDGLDFKAMFMWHSATHFQAT